MSRLVKVRYLTTARGPAYRHDEGQEAEVEEARARELVREEVAVLVDPPVPEPPVEAAAPETAEKRAPEQATAPPQRRAGPQRRPADHAPVQDPPKKG